MPHSGCGYSGLAALRVSSDIVPWLLVRNMKNVWSFAAKHGGPARGAGQGSLARAVVLDFVAKHPELCHPMPELVIAR